LDVIMTDQARREELAALDELWREKLDPTSSY